MTNGSRINGVAFSLYDSLDKCNNKTGAIKSDKTKYNLEYKQSGVLEFSNLDKGTYYLRETAAKAGYDEKPYYNGVEKVDNCYPIIVNDAKNTLISVENKTYCEEEMEKNGLVQGTDYSNKPAEKQKLINIYIYLRDNKYNDFRNLLNFSSPSCEMATPKPELNTSCTSTTISSGTKVKLNNDNLVNSTFGPNDLRQYQKILYKDDANNKLGQNALCVIDYNLNTSFLNEYNNGIKKIKAGSILFEDYQQTNNKLATAELTETCYTFGLSKGSSFAYDNGSDSYGNYIYENSGLNILNQNLSSTSSIAYANNSSTGKFSKTYTISYSRTNYIKKLSGLLLNDLRDNETDVQNDIKAGEECIKKGQCIKVGGLDTKYKGYNEEDPYNADYEFIPTIKITDNYIELLETGEFEEGDKCKFKFEPELITYNEENNSKYKMNLEFKIIDTKNPFPGEDGNGRVIGLNWCEGLVTSGTECTSTYKDGSLNRLVYYETSETISEDIKEKIINAPNSSSTCPKYTITLDSKSIQDIREYNKGHTYQEYNVSCDASGNNCTNTFLSDFGIVKSTDACENGENEELIHHEVERNCTNDDYSYGRCVKDFFDDEQYITISSSGKYEITAISSHCDVNNIVEYYDSDIVYIKNESDAYTYLNHSVDNFYKGKKATIQLYLFNGNYIYFNLGKRKSVTRCYNIYHDGFDIDPSINEKYDQHKIMLSTTGYCRNNFPNAVENIIIGESATVVYYNESPGMGNAILDVPGGGGNICNEYSDVSIPSYGNINIQKISESDNNEEWNSSGAVIIKQLTIYDE